MKRNIQNKFKLWYTTKFDRWVKVIPLFPGIKLEEMVHPRQAWKYKPYKIQMSLPDLHTTPTVSKICKVGSGQFQSEKISKHIQNNWTFDLV